MKPPGSQVINRYRATGKARVTYRVGSEREATTEGRSRAVTAAYNEVIKMIKQDWEKFQLPVPNPGPKAPEL